MPPFRVARCRASVFVACVLLAAGTILGGVPQVVSTSPGGDIFIYIPAFESTNEVEFTTASAG